MDGDEGHVYTTLEIGKSGPVLIDDGVAKEIQKVSPKALAIRGTAGGLQIRMENTRFTSTHNGPPCFVYCTSLNKSVALLERFGGACVEITQPVSFIREVLRELEVQVTGLTRAELIRRAGEKETLRVRGMRCVYRGRKKGRFVLEEGNPIQFASDTKVPGYWLKDASFAVEDEYRFVLYFKSPSDEEAYFNQHAGLRHIDLEVPSLKRFCQLSDPSQFPQ